MNLTNIPELKALTLEETVNIDGGDIDGTMKGSGPDFDRLVNFCVGVAEGFKAGVEAWGKFFAV